MPVSVTANATTCRAAGQRRHVERRVRPAPGRSRSVTEPLSVNLTALESRLRRICCSRCASVTIAGGRSGRDLDPEVQALLLGLRRERLLDVAADLRRSATSVRLDVHPAGLDLGQVEDVVDQRRAGRSRRCGWCGRTRSASRSGSRSGLSASSRASSSSEFSGVRSSWLMLARNSDLYCRGPGQLLRLLLQARAGPARSRGSSSRCCASARTAAAPSPPARRWCAAARPTAPAAPGPAAATGPAAPRYAGWPGSC